MFKKKILYIQYEEGRIEKLERDNFNRLFGDIAEFRIIHPAKGGFDLRDLEVRNDIMKGIDGIIFGQYLQDYPGDYLEMEQSTGILTFINWIIRQNFPILAICSGHQVIAGELKGVVVRRPAGQIERVGIYKIKLTEAGKKAPIYEGIPDEFWTFANHQDTLPAEPAGAVLLAESERHRFQSFKYNEQMWTVQFHPDVDYRAYLDLVNPYPEWWRKIKDWKIIKPIRKLNFLKRLVGEVSKRILVRTNNRMQTAGTSKNSEAANDHENLYYPIQITRNWIEKIAGTVDIKPILRTGYEIKGTTLSQDQIDQLRAEVIDSQDA